MRASVTFFAAIFDSNPTLLLVSSTSKLTLSTAISSLSSFSLSLSRMAPPTVSDLPRLFFSGRAPSLLTLEERS